MWGEMAVKRSCRRGCPAVSMCRFVVLVGKIEFTKDIAFHCLLPASVPQTPVLHGISVALQQSLNYL